jgi:hypothetical protein
MQTVYVFNYTHRFGTDTGVYATRELALKNAAFIMLEWWEDLEDSPDVAASVLEALKSQDYEKAFLVWNKGLMESETMTIEEYMVSPPSEDEKIAVTVAGMLAAIIQAESEKDQSE